MAGYIVQRLLQGAAVLLLLTLAVFLMLALSGDPVRLLLPADAPPEEVGRMRRALGLDDPLLVQYGRFLMRLASLDFGRSIQSGEPALQAAAARMPATLQLALLSATLAFAAGLALGVVSATRRGSWIDSASTTVSLAGQALPVFWVALMLVLLFSVKLRWLPPAGTGTLRHLVLPAGTLALFLVGGIARVVRTSMIEVLGRPYIRAARARGVGERRIIFRHAFKNAAIPILTQFGLQLRFVVGGSVITESVFAWPGIGRLIANAAHARDFPVVQAAVFLVASLLILTNLVMDVLYTWLNPRVRL